MLIIALMSLWLKCNVSHTVNFASDRLFDVMIYLIWDHADGDHEDEPHADEVEELAQALGQLDLYMVSLEMPNVFTFLEFLV